MNFNFNGHVKQDNTIKQYSYKQKKSQITYFSSTKNVLHNYSQTHKKISEIAA